MGMFSPSRNETVNYHYWPIRLVWSTEPCQQTLWQWIRRAIDSRRWTLNYPHRYTCLPSLEVHRAAARRMWHGWPIDGSAKEYGWTLHFGRLKVCFGSKSAPKSKTCRWCAEGGERRGVMDANELTVKEGSDESIQ